MLGEDKSKFWHRNYLIRHKADFDENLLDGISDSLKQFIIEFYRGK